MNFNWKESFVCPVPLMRIGQGDGGKLVCDLRRLKQDDCLVFSIGSKGDFSFETEILKINSKCEIHTVTKIK